MMWLQNEMATVRIKFSATPSSCLATWRCSHVFKRMKLSSNLKRFFTQSAGPDEISMLSENWEMNLVERTLFCIFFHTGNLWHLHESVVFFIDIWFISHSIWLHLMFITFIDFLFVSFTKDSHKWMIFFNENICFFTFSTILQQQQNCQFSLHSEAFAYN